MKNLSSGTRQKYVSSITEQKICMLVGGGKRQSERVCVRERKIKGKKRGDFFHFFYFVFCIFLFLLQQEVEERLREEDKGKHVTFILLSQLSKPL